MAEARKQIQQLLEAKTIERCSSPYNAPVILVSKKDGSTRMCIDFRRLNKITVDESGNIPRLESHLYRLQGTKVYSLLDMTNGYHQIRLTSQSRKLTAFSIDGGGDTFCWRRLPFGLKNAPIQFMSRMTQILPFDFVLIYIDDILVFSNSIVDHLEHLKRIFDVLREYKIILKPKKCTIAAPSVDFLGHRLSSNGIEPLPSKVADLVSLPSPRTKPEAKSLLGFLSFYRRFVKGLAARTQNMYAVVNGRSTFEWNHACETERLDILSDLASSVLSHPNFKSKFVLFTDASEHGIGGALHQLDNETKELQPICYHSRLLTATEKKYHITELEALAVVYFVERNVELLAGKPFTICCDNANLVHIFSPGLTSKHKPSRVTRYALRLSEFTFDIIHVKSNENKVADYLSRYTAGIQQLNIVSTRSKSNQERKQLEIIPNQMDEDSKEVIPSSGNSRK